MQTPNSLPLVLLTWKDANTGGEDVVDLENIASFHKPTIVHTLGWLLYEDSEGVTLVTEFYDAYYRGRTFVPRGMIVSMTPFKLSKPRLPKPPPESSS